MQAQQPLTTKKASRGRGRIRRGRGVVIGHPSPSIRVRLAMGLVDRHPVFMANGVVGLLRQLEDAVDGKVRAPEAIVVGVDELEALLDSDTWRELRGVPLVVILVSDRFDWHRAAHAVFTRAPEPTEVEQLIAA